MFFHIKVLRIDRDRILQEATHSMEQWQKAAQQELDVERRNRRKQEEALAGLQAQMSSIAETRDAMRLVASARDEELRRHKENLERQLHSLKETQQIRELELEREKARLERKYNKFRKDNRSTIVDPILDFFKLKRKRSNIDFITGLFVNVGLITAILHRYFYFS